MQNGRIQKPKPKKNGLTPTYRIDGRTFACEGCKNGHRVSKCTHAGQRPVHMTNDPGRPSADQKRHCDCPKTCTCQKKNCKCPRNCTCVQTMYMLVYVPVDQQKQEGEWKVDKTVLTDLKGKVLTAEEVETRRLEKLRQQGRPSRASTLGAVDDMPVSQGYTTRFETPVSIKTETSTATSASTPKSSCCHRKNIHVEQPVPRVDYDTTVPVRTRRALGSCNCGENCPCEFCLDHPNNKTSQDIAQQRARQYFGNIPKLEEGAFDESCPNPPAQKGLSCMGTKPRFAFHTNPDPSDAEYQAIFGPDATTADGYFLAYDVGSYSADSGAPLGSSSSTISNFHPGFSSHAASSQFSPFGETNAESTPRPHPSKDYRIAPRFLPPQIGSQTESSTLLSLGNEMVQPDHHMLNQSTIPGLYGISSDWADVGARQHTPQQWLPANSDFESSSSDTRSVAPDSNTGSACFYSMPPGTVNHFNSMSTTMNHLLKPPTIGRGEGSDVQAQYQYQRPGPESAYKMYHTSPTIAAPDKYTPDLFNLPLLDDDLFMDMSVSDHGYIPPDTTISQAYPT